MIWIILIVPMFTFCTISNAQDEYKRTIEWQPLQYIPAGTDAAVSESRYFFRFNGCSYRNSVSMLPYYCELIAVGGPDATAELTELIFEPVSSTDQQKTGNTDIPDDLVNESAVRYMQKKPYLELAFIPLRKTSTGQVEKLVSFTVKINVKPQSKGLKQGKRTYRSSSVLASGKWYKIGITTTGIQKISYTQLQDLGIENPASVRVYGYGGLLPESNNQPVYDDLPETAVLFVKGSDGIFNYGDYILFYAKGPVDWKYNTTSQLFTHTGHPYSTLSYYFLTSSFGMGKTIPQFNSIPDAPTHIVTTFTDYAVHEVNIKNLIRSGREFYEPVDVNPYYSYSFNFPNLITSVPVKIHSRVIARSTASSSTFNISINGSTVQSIPVTTVSLSGYTYAASNAVTNSFSAVQDQLNLSLSFINTDASAEGYLDYIIINARRQLQLSANQLLFRDPDSYGAGRIAEFQISGVSTGDIVWDITNPADLRQINGTLAGGVFIFRMRTDSLREFVAFRPSSSFNTPVLQGIGTGLIQNQNLHAMAQANMLIVYHSTFASQASELAAFRRSNDGLTVNIAEIGQIYNEFSSGTPDAGAIRNFAKMFYDRAATEDQLPRYLLLFGDGSYNNLLTSGNTNFIPTYQSYESLSQTNSYTCDDFFTLLDENEGGVSGLMDMGVGRLTVKSTTEAQHVVAKIKRYNTTANLGDWRNILCFIGDDGDGNLHMGDANDLAEMIDTMYPDFTITKIYLDAYTQETTPSGEKYPGVNAAIENRMKSGALMMNYTGHGGELGLAHEHIMRISDAQTYDNPDRLPLFVTASCEFSRYDDYDRTSCGEYLLLNDGGGAIALLSTTRLVYASSNKQLNQSFLRFAFERGPDNKKYRLGDMVRLSKNYLGNNPNKYNFSLLGDPSIALAYPEDRVKTLTINNTDVTVIIDTIKALSKVTVSGIIEDQFGNKQNNFNGILIPTVYDKKFRIKTLGNDAKSIPFEYLSRSSILYKGKVTVNQGNYSFSFIVPKDIRYNFGFGKINYYASNNNRDYHGHFKNFLVGGMSENAGIDNNGPDITLYMNDENFVPGGMTNQDPILIALLNDSSGINTASTGIGHDLSFILDNQQNKKVYLNEYYENDLDSYQSGRINYSLNDLDEGPHNILLKAYDVFNNSSESSLDFIVVKSEELKIEHVFNYPNPFTTYTEFHFEHNQPGNTLEVLIQVFTISGKLVKTIREDIVSEGFRISSIKWNGLDDFGDKIGRGVYIYRLKVRCNGKTVEKIEKLVILR